MSHSFDNTPFGISSPADLPSTPGAIEPSADQIEAAAALGGAFISYQRAGFSRHEAFCLVQTLLATMLSRS